MALTISLMVAAMIALAVLELWAFWALGERADRRRRASRSGEHRPRRRSVSAAETGAQPEPTRLHARRASPKCRRGTARGLGRSAREGRVTQQSHPKASPDRTARSPRDGWRAVHPPSAIVGVSALLVALVALLLLGWGLGEVSRSVAQAADLNLVDELARHRTRLLTPIAHGLSWAGSSFVIAVWTVFFVVLYQRRRVDALTVALSSAGAAVIFYLDKLLVGRPRPPVQHLEAVGGGSFPSGHATLSAGFYLALMIAFLAGKPRRAAVVAAAVATELLVVGIAVSRVYLGVHYPSDVAGGVLLGGMWTAVVRFSLCQTTSSSRPSA